MFLFYFLIFHSTLSQELISPLIFSNCKHLVLPSLCQCYHSGDESQLRCHNIQLSSLPKLPNNMRWHALDFSYNNITSIDSSVFSDIYVEKLNFKSNYLQTIDITAFDRIENLKQLLIDHNKLKEFDPKILASPGISLETFDISYNPFVYLDLGEIILQLPVLKQFYAVSCQLNDSSLNTLIKLTNQNHQYLTLIDLSFNHLTSLCNNLFNGFYTLIELRLNNNNIHLIDNYFIRPLNYLRHLNLAFNSIEYLPSFFSSSLENLNLSSNHIQHLNAYFASHLRSIRTIDFDSNKHLNSISSRSFCFINILTLNKLSFRSNNICSSNLFNELVCRLLRNQSHQNVIDLNHNINLKCDCMLVQSEKYLINYRELTCTQQGQDRYYVSQEKKLFSNCSADFCIKQNLCIWDDAERLILDGTCQGKVIENENRAKNESELITTAVYTSLWDHGNVTDVENLTIVYEQKLKSNAILIERLNFIWFVSLLLVLN